MGKISWVDRDIWQHSELLALLACHKHPQHLSPYERKCKSHMLHTWVMTISYMEMKA